MDTDDRTPIDRGAAITAAASKQPAGEQDEGSFGTALREWRRLCQSRKIRDIVTLNGFYWISLAGTQLTLLPLFMTAEPLALSPAEIGGSFAAISVVSVLFAQPSAHLADKYGKVPCVVLGSGLLSMSMVLIPQTSSFEHLLVALTPLALGSTILSAVPSAYMQDLCEPEDRAQGLALLRTAGDVGLLTGSIFSGIMSEVVGMSSMMACNAGFLAAAMAWYSARSLTYPAGAGAGAGQPSSSSEERSGGQGKGA
jgi:MFS family permease